MKVDVDDVCPPSAPVALFELRAGQAWMEAKRFAAVRGGFFGLAQVGQHVTRLFSLSASPGAMRAHPDRPRA